MPEFKFADKSAIPADMISHAVEKDGAFVLDLDLGSRVREFRDRNTELMKARDKDAPVFARLQKIVGEDPEAFEREVTELRGVATQVKDGKLKGTEAIEAEVTKRVKDKADTLEAQRLEAVEKANKAQTAAQTWQQRHNELALGQHITAATLAADSPANPAAAPDLLARAKGVWEVQEDGSIVAMKGGVKLFSKKGDGTKPLGLAEWLEDVVKESPYLGKTSKGLGANGETETLDASGFNSKEFQGLDPMERVTRYRAAQRKKA